MANMDFLATDQDKGSPNAIQKPYLYCDCGGPEHLKWKNDNDQMGELDPRVGNRSEIGDGSRTGEAPCNSAAYNHNDIVMLRNVEKEDGTVCCFVHKVGPLADEELPLELASGKVPIDGGWYIAKHSWHDFNRLCREKICKPGPLQPICDACLCLVFTVGNVLNDGTVLSDVPVSDLFSAVGPKKTYFAGLYYDGTCAKDPKGKCKGKKSPGCMVIDPTTISDVYDPTCHHIELIGADYDSCSDGQMNMYVRARVLEKMWATG